MEISPGSTEILTLHQLPGKGILCFFKLGIGRPAKLLPPIRTADTWPAVIVRLTGLDVPKEFCQGHFGTLDGHPKES